MRLMILLTGLLLCSLYQTGCHSFKNMINPPEQQQKAALDDFIYALRWKQYNAAAGFMDPEHRKNFLKQLNEQKDLTITDVRLSESLIDPDTQNVEAVIEIDYFLLPSTSLKTLRLEQTWEYNATEDRYRIVTPFPPFP